MPSQRKIHANRLNSLKSSGPRTAAGRRIAARNSLKHGLASISHDQPAAIACIERLVEAYCGAQMDPSIRRQARAVAESELSLRAVRQRQRDVLEQRLIGAQPAVSRDVNEHEAIQGAAPELKRIERYERRAWSRLKRAMRDFVELEYRHAQTMKP